MIITDRTINEKRTLFIGAHCDDIVISSAVTISKKPENSYVITISDGSLDLDVYPIIEAGKIFYTSQEWAKERLKEDLRAMRHLGLDLENYSNFHIKDQRFYENISQIVGGIDHVIREKNIGQLVTHEFPQPHPDHEIACIASHIAAKINDIPVYEYSMYTMDGNGDFFFRSFDDDVSKEIYSHKITSVESVLKLKALKAYETQPFWVEQGMKKMEESFSKVDRDVTVLTDSLPYIEDIKTISPMEVRNILEKYLRGMMQK